MSTAKITAKDTAKLVERLEQLRDEIKLKMHLGKAEVQDLWTELEDKWTEVKRKRLEVEGAGAESAAELKAAVGLLIGELADGYERVRKAL